MLAARYMQQVRWSEPRWDWTRVVAVIELERSRLLAPALEPQVLYADAEGWVDVKTLNQAIARGATRGSLPRELMVTLQQGDNVKTEVRVTQSPGSVEYEVSTASPRPVDMSHLPPPTANRQGPPRWRRFLHSAWTIALVTTIVGAILAAALG